MNYYYIPFFLFIIGSYYYYVRKAKKNDLYYQEKRLLFITENHELTDEQSNNLKTGLPWVGMESVKLQELFGEPRRKRVIDGSMTKFIWSYADIFIYIKNDCVIEWKKK